jgi:hypothetical protein
MSACEPEVMHGYGRWMFYLAGGTLAAALVTGEWCIYWGAYAAVAALLYVFAGALAGK